MGTSGHRVAPSLSFHPEGEGAEGFSCQFHAAMEGGCEGVNSELVDAVPEES